MRQSTGDGCSAPGPATDFLATKSLLVEKSQDIFRSLVPSERDITENGVPKFKELMSDFSNLFAAQARCVVIEKRELQSGVQSTWTDFVTAGLYCL